MTLREEVLLDAHADLVLNLESNRMEVHFELLNDGDSSHGRERVPQDGGEDVGVAKRVVASWLVLRDDFGERVLRAGVERLEVLDDETVGHGAILLADPRELGAFDGELGEGDVDCVEHVPHEFGRPRLELDSSLVR